MLRQCSSVTVLMLALLGSSAPVAVAAPGDKDFCRFTAWTEPAYYRFNASVNPLYKDVTFEAREKWNARSADIQLRGTSDNSIDNIGVHVFSDAYIEVWAYVEDNDDPQCHTSPKIWPGNDTHIWYNQATMSQISNSNKAIVAAHEFGHTLGLSHPADGSNCYATAPNPSIMYQGPVKFANCLIPRARDVDNVRSIYN